MSRERQLYRSRNALVGGVCAGIAERFDTDPVVVRILFLAFAVLTLGLGAFPYLALWAVLPKKPMQIKPVEVEPDSVRSDTFGAVDCRCARGAAAQRSSRTASYVGAAHLPPVPPAVAGDAARVRREGDVVPDGRPAPACEADECRQSSDPSAGQIVFALLVGCLLVSFGASLAVSGFMRGVTWWQCWPLALVSVGVVRMAVPGARGRQALAFSLGLMVLAAGLVLLSMSMGFVSWATLPKMFAGLWPLPIAAAVLLALGIRMGQPVATIAAGALFALFCALGLGLLSEPGPLRDLAFVTPLGREYSFFLPFKHLA